MFKRITLLLTLFTTLLFMNAKNVVQASEQTRTQSFF